MVMMIDKIEMMMIVMMTASKNKVLLAMITFVSQKSLHSHPHPHPHHYDIE
jgi:hypothetical protein